MCLLHSQSRSRRSRAYLVAGMMCLALAALCPAVFPAPALHSHDTTNLCDFFHGLFFGLSFTFTIASIVAQSRPPNNTPAS